MSRVGTGGGPIPGRRPILFEHTYDPDVSLRPFTPGKPCWVRPPNYTAGEVPGILVGWRRTDQGYEGRVVYATPGYGTVREGWLSAGCIRPAC